MFIWLVRNTKNIYCHIEILLQNINFNIENERAKAGEAILYGVVSQSAFAECVALTVDGISTLSVLAIRTALLFEHNRSFSTGNNNFDWPPTAAYPPPHPPQ